MLVAAEHWCQASISTNRRDDVNGDQAMRAHSSSLPGPTFDSPAFATPGPLASATVAIVTSAALHTPNDDAFAGGDTSYRLIDRSRRDLVTGPLPGPRALEDWFFEHTETGRVVLAARDAIRESGARSAIWFYMAPATRTL